MEEPNGEIRQDEIDYINKAIDEMELKKPMFPHDKLHLGENEMLDKLSEARQSKPRFQKVSQVAAFLEKNYKAGNIIIQSQLLVNSGIDITASCLKTSYSTKGIVGDIYFWKSREYGNYTLKSDQLTLSNILIWVNPHPIFPYVADFNQELLIEKTDGRFSNKLRNEVQQFILKCARYRNDRTLRFVFDFFYYDTLFVLENVRDILSLDDLSFKSQLDLLQEKYYYLVMATNILEDMKCTNCF